MSQELSEQQLSWVVLAQGLSEVAQKVKAGRERGRAVIRRLSQGWRISFQDGSLTWLLARGLSISLCGPVPRLLECPSYLSAGFPHNQASITENKEENAMPFMG